MKIEAYVESSLLLEINLKGAKQRIYQITVIWNKYHTIDPVPTRLGV